MDVLPYQVVRYEPKDFKVRRPDEKGGLVWNRKGVQLILYRLPELLAAALEKLVFITEGEKDADRLTVLGLVATTNPFGAGKFHLIKNLVPLRGRRVVVLPDNDRDGRNHAQDVANRLQGVAESIQVLELPGPLAIQRNIWLRCDDSFGKDCRRKRDPRRIRCWKNGSGSASRNGG